MTMNSTGKAHRLPQIHKVTPPTQKKCTALFSTTCPMNQSTPQKNTRREKMQVCDTRLVCEGLIGGYVYEQGNKVSVGWRVSLRSCEC
ncbi:hypothetical protein FKM82_008454 [Ascaphus truei]